MGNAIWLFFALPEWYFSTILAPFRTGLLSAIPALGIVCLIFGVVCGTLKRRLDLSAFLVLPVASQALALVAGFMRGSLTHQVSEPILAIFTLLQIAVAGYFIFRLEGARTAATALAIFTSSYAFFAAFVAGMAFTDRWL